MNDLEQAMMNEPNDSTSEDVPSHTERRAGGLMRVLLQAATPHGQDHAAA